MPYVYQTFECCQQKPTPLYLLFSSLLHVKRPFLGPDHQSTYEFSRHGRPFRGAWLELPEAPWHLTLGVAPGASWCVPKTPHLRHLQGVGGLEQIYIYIYILYIYIYYIYIILYIGRSWGSAYIYIYSFLSSDQGSHYLDISLHARVWPLLLFERVRPGVGQGCGGQPA